MTKQLSKQGDKSKPQQQTGGGAQQTTTVSPKKPAGAVTTASGGGGGGGGGGVGGNFIPAIKKSPKKQAASTSGGGGGGEGGDTGWDEVEKDDAYYRAKELFDLRKTKQRGYLQTAGNFLSTTSKYITTAARSRLNIKTPDEIPANIDDKKIAEEFVKGLYQNTYVTHKNLPLLESKFVDSLVHYITKGNKDAIFNWAVQFLRSNPSIDNSDVVKQFIYQNFFNIIKQNETTLPEDGAQKTSTQELLKSYFRKNFTGVNFDLMFPKHLKDLLTIGNAKGWENTEGFNCTNYVNSANAINLLYKFDHICRQIPLNEDVVKSFFLSLFRIEIVEFIYNTIQATIQPVGDYVSHVLAGIIGFTRDSNNNVIGVILFRGTSSFEEWMHNLYAQDQALLGSQSHSTSTTIHCFEGHNFRGDKEPIFFPRKGDKNLKVHKGFYNYYTSKNGYFVSQPSVGITTPRSSSSSSSKGAVPQQITMGNKNRLAVTTSSHTFNDLVKWENTAKIGFKEDKTQKIQFNKLNKRDPKEFTFTDIPSIQDTITAAVEKICSDHGGNVSFIIGGHSLGAAMATLVAFDMSYGHYKLKTQPTVQSVYAFSCPRVGNAEFAKEYNYRVPEHFRIQNDGDIVPQLPPTFMPTITYQHVGRLFSINNPELTMVISRKQPPHTSSTWTSTATSVAYTGVKIVAKKIMPITVYGLTLMPDFFTLVKNELPRYADIHSLQNLIPNQDYQDFWVKFFQTNCPNEVQGGGTRRGQSQGGGGTRRGQGGSGGGGSRSKQLCKCTTSSSSSVPCKAGDQCRLKQPKQQQQQRQQQQQQQQQQQDN